MLALGDTDEDNELLGLIDADSELLGLTDADIEAEGETLGLTEADGDTDALILADGHVLVTAVHPSQVHSPYSQFQAVSPSGGQSGESAIG